MVRRALLLLVVTLAASGAGAEPPARVVSMNLCTDQMALLLAEPGQLVSVSWLSQDPRASALAEAAAALPANHGQAEEIALLRPDLVLAGAYSGGATVALLRRMGHPVEVFAPEESLADIRTNLTRMGRLLGREAEATALVAEFDARLEALTGEPLSEPRPRAALYAANGYTSGDRSLSGAILHAAGYDNIAAELGIDSGGVLPLEQLVLAAPDLVVRSGRQPGASRAEEILDHPALRRLLDRAPSEVLSEADWICGTPSVLDAIARLRAAGGVSDGG